MKYLAVLFAVCALTACKYEDVEHEVGYKGKARIDPWLAAERFVKSMGKETLPVISWTAPTSADAVWMVPAAILNNESFTRRMEQWVRHGGHLILLVEHADAQTNDWSDYNEPAALVPALTSMLGRFGIELTKDKGSKVDHITFDGRDFKVEAEPSGTVSENDEDPDVFASVAAGQGRLTVLMDARIFRNRWIGDNDHAALLDALLKATHRHGRVGFMRGSGLSLWGMLKDYLTPVLWGVGVLVLLWLWKNITRFGPIEAEAAPLILRGYEHHLEALGNFQWRIDRTASLLAPLREQIVELGQRMSARTGHRDGDFFQFLADRAGLTRERVAQALTESVPADSTILIHTTADIQQLLKVLHHPSQL